MAGRESTPVSFTREELNQIREMLDKHAKMQCPICGGHMESGGIYDERGSKEDVWALTCETCNRMAILRDVVG